MLPELEKMKKQSPFVVPEDYFDEFSEHLNQRIKKEEEHKSVFRKTYTFFKPAIGLAASIILVFLLVFSPFRKSTKTTNSAMHPIETVSQQSQSVSTSQNEEVTNSNTIVNTKENNLNNKSHLNTTDSSSSPTADEIGDLVSDYDIVYAEQ